ncbi:MAG: hypothetical protein NZ898_05885 [Myxococcota bacterium]|nr:hypothetical protein [Myxococcota bacterium]
MALSAACALPEEPPQGRSVDAESCGLLPQEGCPCRGHQTAQCHLEPVMGDGSVLCFSGVRRCVGGRWSACEDVVARPATAAGGDGDVGGATEALRIGPLPCSVCRPDCFTNLDQPGPEDLPGNSENVEFDPALGGVRLMGGGPMVCMSDSCRRNWSTGTGTGTPWSPTPDNSEGVVVDPSDGALTLGFSTSRAHGVWIASMNGATVSRFDPETGREVARYPSARPDAVNLARPWDEGCNWANTGNCPSRTAVDQIFDAYVANRAFGNQPTVTKYAAALERCVDRNANGVIDTSRDLNGNGFIDMGTAEFVGPNDECLLWTVRVGGWSGVARALAIGVAPAGVDVGDVWVGNFNEQRAYRLNPTTGATTGSVSIAPVTPYGAAAGPDGRIWFTGGTAPQPLGAVHPATMTYHPAAVAPNYWVWPYGIAVWSDPAGTQTYIYIAEWGGHGIRRYNPATNTWFRRDLNTWWPGYIFYTGGLGADETRLWSSLYGFYVWDAWWGWLWYGSCQFLSFRLPDIDDARIYGPAGCPAWNYHGAGVGFDGSIWAVGLGSNNVVRLMPDRTTYQVSPQVLATPYTYSDFIGYGLNTFANPRGHYRFVVDSTCNNFRWESLTWRATTPPGTSVEMRVRSANSMAALAAQPWRGPWTTSPANLQAAPGPVPDGRFLEVEVRLATTDRRTTPRVYDVGVTGGCPTASYPPSGSYTRVYDAATVCPGGHSGTRAIWGDLTFSVTTPAGTRIDWEIRGADSVAALAAATPIVRSTPPTGSPIALDPLFAAAMGGRHPFAVSIRAVLHASADRTQTPVLHWFALNYVCGPAE